MATINKIVGVEIKKKDNKTFSITHVILDDGEEATGYGEFEVGEKVQRFFDERYGKIKVKKNT